MLLSAVNVMTAKLFRLHLKKILSTPFFKESLRKSLVQSSSYLELLLLQ